MTTSRVYICRRHMTIELFPFRYRDPRSGKWVRARYRATRQEIAARYAEWEITGDAELRADEPVQMFNPALPMLVNGLRADVAPDMQPAIDALGAVHCISVPAPLRDLVRANAASRPRRRCGGALPPPRMKPSAVGAADLMHATLVRRAFNRPGWAFENKLDGFRALARREGDRIDLLSRTGRMIGSNFPEVVAALRRLPGSWVIDGESLPHPSAYSLTKTGDLAKLSLRSRKRIA